MACIITGTLIVRWVVFGARTFVGALRTHALNLWALLDYLSPSETEAVRESKQEQVIRVLHETVSSVPLSAMVGDWSSYTVLVGVVSCVTTSVALWITCGYVGRSAKRVVMRMRGIHFESLREGSPLRVSPIPKYQVAVMRPGMLCDSHIGYGIRVGMYLVTPRHVLTDTGDLPSEMLLSGAKGKIVTVVSATPSLAVDDLVYCYLDETSWSRLGTSSARLARQHYPAHVTCTGVSGQSTGRLEKMSIRWMLMYGGSTVPGMSGAAYDFRGEVHGIHQGASGAANLGFSAVLIGNEVRGLMVPEDSADTNVGPKPSRFVASATRKVWDEAAALAELERRRAKRTSASWAEEMGLDDVRDYDDRHELGLIREKANKATLEFPVDMLKVTPQSDDAQEMALATVPTELLDYLSAMRSYGVLEKVKALIGEQDINRPVCSVCGAKPKTQEKLANHMKSSHPPKTPALTEQVQTTLESAVPVDTGAAGKMVRQGPFLGVRSNLQKAKKKSYVSTSNAPAKNNRSQLLEESLKSLLDSQKNIEKLLSALVQTTPGQSSANRPN